MSAKRPRQRREAENEFRAAMEDAQNYDAHHEEPPEEPSEEPTPRPSRQPPTVRRAVKAAFNRQRLKEWAANPISLAAVALVAILTTTVGCQETKLTGEVQAASVQGDTLHLRTPKGTATVTLTDTLRVSVSDEQTERIRLKQLSVAEHQAVLLHYQAQQAALETAIKDRERLLAASSRAAEEETRRVVAEISNANAKPETLAKEDGE